VSTRSPRSAGLTRALHNARTLSRNDWLVLAGAIGLLPAASVGLRLVGLRGLLAVIEALASARRPSVTYDPDAAARAARLVETAARYCLPRPTCLAKALVVFSLLRRRGLPVDLVIGVTKARGPLEGHAWVRLGGAIVVGNPGPSGYVALVRIPCGQPTAPSLALGERAP